MSLVFEIFMEILETLRGCLAAGQTLNSYYKSHIVNIIDTILNCNYNANIWYTLYYINYNDLCISIIFTIFAQCN